MAKRNKNTIIQNPRNPDSSLFRRLTRLLSGPIVNYQRQTERNLKRRKLIKYNIKDVSGKEFKKSAHYPFQNLQAEMLVNHQRAERYQDFNQMEFEPLIASSLDVYSDEMTTSNTFEKLLKIECANEDIKDVLNTLFYDILNIEYNLHGWSRTLCKYGDMFLYLDIDSDLGIKHVIGLPPAEVERLEGEDDSNPNYVQYKWSAANLTLESWQCAHFRVLGNDKFAPYGTCHKFDTRIYTADGVKEIKDVNKNDKVLSFDLETQKTRESTVLDVVNSGVKKCFEIRTRHNFIETSKEHRILVFDKNKGFIYKSVDELRIKDLLVVDKEHNLEKEIRIDKTKPEGKNFNGFWNSIDNVPEVVTEDFARLFGFLIGDGWCHKTNGNVCFAIGEYENLNILYASLLEKYTGVTGSKSESAPGQIVFYSKMFKTILQRMGFVGDVYSKRIPEWVFSASTEVKKAFIRGLVDADGSLFIDKWDCCRYQIELTNEQLIKDFKVLIQTLGWKTGKISSRKRNNDCVIDGRIIKNRKRSYYFYFFENKILQAKKHDNIYRNSDQYVLEPIVSIEESGDYETYDIYVEDENHNFISNGIVTHNSVLDPARRVWRQMVLLEDAMMAYRITRSPERRVFYIDVGNINPQDVEAAIHQVQQNTKRNQVVDADTGRVDLRYNPLSVDEDFYIPVRGQQSSTRIESLPGGNYTGDIDDVKYLKDKLFAALKIPQSYLFRGEGADEDKSTLAQKDIRFARTIQRLQRAVVSELRKMATIHLYIMGFRGEDLTKFQLSLNNPSKIAELQELEYWRTKFDVAGSATDNFFSKRWVGEKLFHLSEEDMLRNHREMFYDRALDSQLEAIASAGEGEGGGGLGGMGDDLGSDLGDADLGGDEDLGGNEGDAGTDDLGGDEDETLLAAPAKRDEEGYLTPGAKGKIYKPVKSDKRDMGARKRSIQSKYSQESSSNTKRNVFKGAGELSSLARGISENKETIYKKEEDGILNVHKELKDIIESLEVLPRDPVDSETGKEKLSLEDIKKFVKPKRSEQGNEE